MPDLESLRARVREATGELDIETLGQLICAIEGKPFGEAWISCGDDGSDELTVRNAVERGYGSTVWSGYRWRAPDVSIDAALALVERKLPGWSYQVSRTKGTRGPFCIARVSTATDADVFGFDAVHDFAPLAILDALLSALISLRDSDNG